MAGADLPPVNIDGVTERLKRVEADTNRQNHIQRDRVGAPAESAGHRREALGEKVEVLKQPQQTQIQNQAADK